MRSKKKIGDVHITFEPASVYCYTLGYNIIKHKEFFPSQRMHRLAAEKENDAKQQVGKSEKQ